MIDENGPATADEAVATDAPGDEFVVASEVSESEAELPVSGFAGMNLDADIQDALADMGYLAPMEVQTAVFQDVMEGRDIMVQSRTGSGKTAAFGIPIAQRLDPTSSGAQVLILAPTRELALQVSDELKRITRRRQLAVVPIYGGAPMKPQIDALTAGAQIIAGTPGRVLDHIRRKTLKTGGIKFLVLDECDEMLSMGFQEEIENILQTLPPREERQTMLFSATIPEAIERIARRHMRDPLKISLSHDGIGVREISHYYYMVSGLARTRDLLKVLKAEKPESAIIFCNTREDTATVAKYLARHGYDAEAISSDLTQKDRERVMKRTRDKNLQFMVATDIAARGIDISDLSHVINYQFPESPEVYVHRTGRTGRAGKAGVALSLVGPREIGAFYYLKLIYKIRPQERDLPSAEELLTMQEGEQYERVVQLVPEKPTAQYLSLARRLWQSVEGERVVGALLQRLLGSQEMGLGMAPAAPRPARVREPADVTEEMPRVATGPEGGEEPRRRARDEDRGPPRSRDRDRDRDRGPRARSEGGRGERGRDRDRGGRDRERGGRDRDRGGRERERGGRDRDAKRTVVAKGNELLSPARAAGAPAAAAPPSSSSSSSADAGREFWEAWADEKVSRTSSDNSIPVVPMVSEAPTEIQLDEAGVSGSPPDPVNDADSDGAEGSEGDDLTARLYVNIGKREEATADEIRELLCRDLGDDAARIGSIALRNTHAYVRVPEDLVDRVIEAARGKSYKERELVVERARR